MPRPSLRLILAIVLLASVPAGEVTLTPTLVRVDLAGGETREVSFSLLASVDAQVLDVAVDCRCLAVLTPLPLSLRAGVPATLTVRTAGVATGIERLTLRTSLGSASAAVQVVTAGLGQGRDTLERWLVRAAAESQQTVLVLHDLDGQVRNCGCSAGSLGGADLIAGIPGLVSQLAGGRTACLMSGDIDGGVPGLEAALRERGWQRDTDRLVAADDPMPMLEAHPTRLVVVPPRLALGHARLIQPLANGGMTLTLLRLDAAGRIASQHAIPVDRSFTGDPVFLMRFPGQLSATVRTRTDLAGDCRGCHATASAVWDASAHARAWNSLGESDRIDACVGCHSTAIPHASLTLIAPHVGCRSCHSGSEPHVTSGGTVKTSGVTDCRSCHDAKHHPAFQMEQAWPLIGHGREPMTKPQR